MKHQWVHLPLLLIMLSGCSEPPPPVLSSENAYRHQAESEVRQQLGTPSHEFEGHYGGGPDEFTQQFTGEIKTLVFNAPGGKHYVSFEKRGDGWVCICSSWLPEGAVF